VPARRVNSSNMRFPPSGGVGRPNGAGRLRSCRMPAGWCRTPWLGHPRQSLWMCFSTGSGTGTVTDGPMTRSPIPAAPVTWGPGDRHGPGRPRRPPGPALAFRSPWRAHRAAHRLTRATPWTRPVRSSAASTGHPDSDSPARKSLSKRRQPLSRGSGGGARRATERRGQREPCMDVTAGL
jgi:hypothetical protein